MVEEKNSTILVNGCINNKHYVDSLTSKEYNKLINSKLYDFYTDNGRENIEEKYNFIFNEILRIFRVHSISTVYKEKEIVLQTVIKPHYNTYVNTENDRISYVVLNLSHIYNKNLRI